MNKSVRSGAVAGGVVAFAILGTWLLATTVFDRSAGVPLQRLQPPHEQEAIPQAPACEKPIAEHAAIVQASPTTASSRDEHFTQVLDQLASRQRQEAFNTIFNGNEWRNEESVSGDGSTEFYTRNARTLLAHTFTEYGIKDWIDSPCGDCNWQPRIEGFANVSYLGLDIVPGVPLWHDNATVGLIEHNKAKFIRNQTNMSFKQQDFINEPFPHQPDLILCRDMIQHNSLVDGVRAYYNIERSGAKYLATTWHQQGAENTMGHNVNQPPGGMYYVNVFLHPFNFSRPEFFIREGHVPPGFVEDEKFIGVWKLPALGLGDGQYFNMPQETYNKADTSLIYTMEMATPPPPV